MAENEKLKPKRRFKKFQNAQAWEQRKLGELGDFKNGMNFNKDAMGHGYPFVNLQDIFGKTIIDVNCLGLAESTDRQREEYSLKKGDVLFVRSSVKPAGVGETALVANDFPNTTYSGFIIRFRAYLELEDQFKRYIFTTKSIRNQIMTKATSSANTNINQDSLGLTKIYFLLLTEQSAIGNFFCTLDNLITIHQCKLEKVKALKSAYLSEMFPAEGECVPKRRFTGFTDEWEQRKFEDVFVTLQNNTLSRAELNSERGIAKNIHYGDILIKYGECLDVSKEEIPFIENEIFILKYKASYLQNGDVIFADAAEDETVGKCSEIVGVDNEILISGLHTIPCRPNQSFGIGYLGYYMNSDAFHNQLLPLIQGTKVSSISKSALQTTTILYPKSEIEQTKIGHYFFQLDNLITHHQHKLDKLQNIKKAYLNEMFV